MLSESLKRVRISISVGKVVKSVGFGTYNEISKIKTDKAIEIVSKTSNIEEGRGTMIMASIAITKKTTPRSRLPSKKLREVPIFCFVVNFLAKCQCLTKFSRRVSLPKSSLPKTNLFSPGVCVKKAILYMYWLFRKDSLPKREHTQKQ